MDRTLGNPSEAIPAMERDPSSKNNSLTVTTDGESYSSSPMSLYPALSLSFSSMTASTSFMSTGLSR